MQVWQVARSVERRHTTAGEIGDPPTHSQRHETCTLECVTTTCMWLTRSVPDRGEGDDDEVQRVGPLQVTGCGPGVVKPRRVVLAH